MTESMICYVENGTINPRYNLSTKIGFETEDNLYENSDT